MVTPMIEIKHLSYAIRCNPILKNISLTFPRGKITGIIGPNGCGKSTLLAHVARLRPSRETIFIDGTPVETIPAADYARKLAVLAQRHLQMAAELSVRDVVLMGRYPYKERFQSYSPHDIEVAEAVMQQFRILSMAEKKIGMLSGGELQRVFVAKALAQEPEVLLLDEPTNHLDVKYKISLMEELRRFDGTVVIVLHDLGLAARYCDHAAVLRAGEIVAEGAAQDVLTPALLEDVFEVPFFTSIRQDTRYLYY